MELPIWGEDFISKPAWKFYLSHIDETDTMMTFQENIDFTNKIRKEKVMSSKSIIHNGFKLKSLDIKGHPILGDNTFNFIDENDSSESIYFTVLIGSNGTGKSELFRCLLELFRGVYQMRDRSFSVQYFFTLEF